MMSVIRSAASKSADGPVPDQASQSRDHAEARTR